MGLIFDSSILIASERSGESLRTLIRRMQALFGETIEAGMSAVSVIELTHGVYRAKLAAQRDHRREFVEELCRDLVVYPLTVQIAQLAGRLEGEQAAKGFVYPFEHLAIGATALYLGFGVATLNVRHFRLIPDLELHTL